MFKLADYFQLKGPKHEFLSEEVMWEDFKQEDCFDRISIDKVTGKDISDTLTKDNCGGIAALEMARLKELRVSELYENW